MKKILITGSTGMLGSDFIRTFSAGNQYDVYGLGRSIDRSLSSDKQFTVDLSKPFHSNDINIRPDIIIHTAAITDLTLCECNPELAAQVHVKASQTLGEMLTKEGRFIYISTDSVFDGTRGNYSETDHPIPLNVYALTKLKGEEAVRNVNPQNTSIIRTNIYGYHVPLKNSLVEWAFKEWIEGKKISGFTDIFFNAVFTHQLVNVIKFMIDNDITYPILHVGSSSVLSKYDFLQQLRDGLKILPDMLSPALSENFPSAIQRPKNTSLDTTLLSTFYKIPGFDDGIKEVTEALSRTLFSN